MHFIGFNLLAIKLEGKLPLKPPMYYVSSETQVSVYCN